MGLTRPFRELGAELISASGLSQTPPRVKHRRRSLRATHGRTLRLPDALVVATARVLVADRIVTTDAGWPALPVRVEVIKAETSARGSR